jgi:uncharacterized protein (UPF0548 family)
MGPLSIGDERTATAETVTMCACGHHGRMPTILSDHEVTALERAPFTYPDVGATATHPPEGYRPFGGRRRLRRRDFATAADELLTWRVQERAGLAVAASAARVSADGVVRMRLGLGPVGMRIPCRVVYVVEDAGRAGFAYGSLPGHPEAGEEAFVLEQGQDGTLTFSVSGFSRLASRLARAGGPVSRTVQMAMIRRYLAALDS